MKSRIAADLVEKKIMALVIENKETTGLKL